MVYPVLCNLDMINIFFVSAANSQMLAYMLQWTCKWYGAYKVVILD